MGIIFPERHQMTPRHAHQMPAINANQEMLAGIIKDTNKYNHLLNISLKAFDDKKLSIYHLRKMGATDSNDYCHMLIHKAWMITNQEMANTPPTGGQAVTPTEDVVFKLLVHQCFANLYNPTIRDIGDEEPIVYTQEEIDDAIEQCELNTLLLNNGHGRYMRKDEITLEDIDNIIAVQQSYLAEHGETILTTNTRIERIRAMLTDAQMVVLSTSFDTITGKRVMGYRTILYIHDWLDMNQLLSIEEAITRAFASEGG